MYTERYECFNGAYLNLNIIYHENDGGGNNEKVSYLFDLYNDQFPYTEIVHDEYSLEIKITGAWENQVFIDILYEVCKKKFKSLPFIEKIKLLFSK